MLCKEKSPEHGRCQQPVFRDELCGYHLRRSLNPAAPVDRFYERKVFHGLIEPTDHWMSQVEVRALFSGRPKGDGRRIDHWTKR